MLSPGFFCLAFPKQILYNVLNQINIGFKTGLK